jgi:murein DD-endopeptidase MepM/ murein hydrolase activator NlpD/pimeloyl-ACP methyl ester carboxylesterase
LVLPTTSTSSSSSTSTGGINPAPTTDITTYDFKFKILNKLNDLSNVTTKFEVQQVQLDTNGNPILTTTDPTKEPTTVHTYTLNDQTLTKNQQSSYAFTWNAGLLDTNNQYVVKVTFSNQSGVINNEQLIMNNGSSSSSSLSSAASTSSSSSTPFTPGTILTPPIFTNPQALSFKPYTGNILANVGSQTITVFHDTEAPTKHDILNIGSPSYSTTNPTYPSTIPDWISTPSWATQTNPNNCNQPLTNNNLQGTNPNPIYSLDSTLKPECISKTPITKDTSITTNIQGERKADVELKKYFAKNNPSKANTVDPITGQLNTLGVNQFTLQGTGPQRNGDGGTSDRIMAIGDNSRDDSATNSQNQAQNCTTISNTPIKNRRIGTCSDGLYKFRLRMVDSSGNNQTTALTSTQTGYTANQPGYSGDTDNLDSWVYKVVERDSVSPSPANLTASKINPIYKGVIDPYEEYLKLQINNSESYTEAYFTITDQDGANRYPDGKLDSNGNLTINNAWGEKLDCGNLTYTISVRLKDRAGNYSQNISTTITTGECAACSYSGDGTFINPIQNTTTYGKVTSHFGTPRRNGPHAGVDFSVAYNGNVVSVQDGTIDHKGYEDGGWGNYIIIKHILPNSKGTTDTFFTIYAHLLSYSTKPVGAGVSQGEVIGKGGNIGSVFPLPTPANPTAGTHLHFQIQKLGAPLIAGMSRATASGNRGNVIDPSFLLAQIQGNITNPTLIAKYCEGNGTGQSADNQEPDYPNINKEQALNSFLNYIRTNLTNYTILESRDDNKSTYLKVSDLSPDNTTAKQQLSNYINYPTGNNSYNAIGTSGTWILRIGNDTWDSLKVISTNESGNKGVLAVNTRQQLNNDTSNPNNNSYKVYTVKNSIYQRYKNESFGASPIGVPTNEETPGRTKSNTPATNATSAVYQSFERGYNSKKYNHNRIFWGNHPQEQGEAKYVVNEVANKYQDDNSVQTYGYPTGNTYGNNGADLCKQWFENGKEIDVCVDLTQSITLHNAGKTLNNNKNTGKYYFKVVSNRSQDRFKYNQNSDVWILIHGWKNDSNNWACSNTPNQNDFANTILSKKQDSTILCLDWSDISASDPNQANLEADLEATWIDSVSSSIVERLKLWGLDENTANTKLNLVGHSLGTIMGATISEKYNKANYLIAMDPPGRQPANLASNVHGFYAINKDENKMFSSFSQKVNFTRSFSTVGTPSDSPNLGSTADESFLVYMDGIGNPFDLHWMFKDKVKEFLGQQNNFCNIYTSCDYFNTWNKTGNGFPKANLTTNIALQQNHSGLILTTGANDRNLEYLAIKENNSDNMILLGNNQNNNQMSPNLTDLKKDRDYIMYGRDGDDVFLNPDSDNYTKNISVKDFKDGGDRLSLWQQQYATSEYNHLAKKYTYNNNNGEHQIKIEKCIKFNIGGVVFGCSEQVSVKVEGGRVNDNSVNWENAIRDRDPNVFIFR